MQPAEDENFSIRFENWEIRPSERTVLFDGKRVALGSRAFDVLLILVRRAGAVVTKRELIDLAWPGLVVEENNLSVQVAALRKALGAKSISTAPGVGYRLSAPQRRTSAPSVEKGPDSPRSRGVRRSVASELFGRDVDIAAIVELVANEALVSIIGTGGIGKTSVARAVLGHQKRLEGDEGYLVDLSPLRESTQVVPLLAKTLGLVVDGSRDPIGDVVFAMAQSQALIVFDNCEHLLAEVASIVLRALDWAPQVRWLVTSQLPLRLPGEFVYRLGPLQIPGDDVSVENALTHGAIILLHRRATRLDRNFKINASNLSIVIDLCRQLDGLPLAIEMAAAGIAKLGLMGAYRQLGRRLRLLEGPRGAPQRHSTLGSTFEWSYGLLSTSEQTVFRHLACFIGGFTIPTVQQVVCAASAPVGVIDADQVVEIMAALAERSLIHRANDQTARFYLYESTRSYAWDQLKLNHEHLQLQVEHAKAIASMFDQALIDIERLRDDEWAARYMPERHNLRSALQFAAGLGDPDLFARLVAPLALVDTFAGTHAEIVQLNVSLGSLRGAGSRFRAVASVELSWAHFRDGNKKMAASLAQQARSDFEDMGDTAGCYRALAQLVRIYEASPGMLHEQYAAEVELSRLDDRALSLRTRLFCIVTAGRQYGGDRSIGRLEELMRIAEHAGFSMLASICRVHITDQLLVERRFGEAVTASRMFLANGEMRPRMRALLLLNQTLALVQEGRLVEAYEPAKLAVRILPMAIKLVVEAFALAAARTGNAEDSAILAGHGARIRAEREERPDPAEESSIAETNERLNELLSPPRLLELRNVGAALSGTDILKLVFP